MSDRSGLRLFVLRVLVVSLLLTLVGRLWYLQVLAGNTYTKAAANLSTRDIVTAPARGEILDDRGRALARNRTALVVSVDRIALLRQPHDGAAVLHRLSKVVHVSFPQLKRRITPCGPQIPKPCWNGSPYQPIPVTDRANTRMARQILEEKENFPGVSAEVEAVRNYPEPSKANAAHLLGYLRPVTAQDLKAKNNSSIEIHGSDLIGATGLESTYDQYLRGRAGLQTVSVDALGGVTGTLNNSAPHPGDSVVTSLDANVQRDLEQALASGIHHAQADGLGAKTAAGVVLNARTGHVVAAASLPTYNPNVWVPRISRKAYRRLGSKKLGQPILDRVTQGLYSPGSTFKLITTTAVVKEHRASFTGTYSCPGALKVGASTKHNFEFEVGGTLSLHETIVRSCDTVYYQFAIDDWNHDEHLIAQGKKPLEAVQKMSRSFGFGRPTGIDLPSESSWPVEDRAFKLNFWKTYLKRNACAGIKKHAPGSYLRKLDQENCTDGWRFEIGDQANFDIGQGTVLCTPLQLAVAYEALVNGGKLRSPRIGEAVLSAGGKLVRRIRAPVTGRIPVAHSVLNDIMTAMYGVTTEAHGTASGAFAGFPMHKVQVGGKTGTAEAPHNQTTSWFASFGGPPGQKPQYVVIAMIPSSGQGAQYAAPVVRQVWDGIYGLEGHPAALPNGAPPQKLPKIRPDGTIATPPAPRSPQPSSPSPTSTTGALPAFLPVREVGRR